MAYQLDEAVLYFGRWVEGKLSERDKKGKRKYTIEQVFNPQSRVASVTALLEASGADVIDI